MHALVLLHFSWILVKNVYIEYIFCFYYNCMFIFKGDHPFDRRLSIVTYVCLFMSSRHVLRQHVRVRNLSGNPLSAVQTRTVRPRIRIRRQPPLFPPETWNVFNATVSNTQRTNNETKAWNNAFARQIGHSHPSLYRLLDNLRKDTALVHIALEAEARGHPARKRVRRATRELQERLQNLCVARRDGSKSVAEALRGLGHTIRFV